MICVCCQFVVNSGALSRERTEVRYVLCAWHVLKCCPFGKIGMHGYWMIITFVSTEWNTVLDTGAEKSRSTLLKMATLWAVYDTRTHKRKSLSPAVCHFLKSVTADLVSEVILRVWGRSAAQFWPYCMSFNQNVGNHFLYLVKQWTQLYRIL